MDTTVLERLHNCLQRNTKLEAVIDVARTIVKTAKSDEVFPMNTSVLTIRMNMLQEALEALDGEESE